MSRNHINEYLHNFDEKVEFLNRTLREIALKTFTYKNTDQKKIQISTHFLQISQEQ